MGLVWWIYGIGCQGPRRAWKVRGRQLRRPHPGRGRGRRTSSPEPDQLPDRRGVPARPTPSWPSSSRRPRASSAPSSATCSSVDPDARGAAAGRPARRVDLLASVRPADRRGAGRRRRPTSIDERKLFDGASRLRRRRRVRATAARSASPDDADLLDRIWFKAKRDPHVALRPPAPTTRSSRSSRWSRRRPSRARPPPLPEADETKPVDLGDHGARPRRPRACPAVDAHDLRPGIVFAVLLQHAPPARQARRRGASRAAATEA